MLYPDLNLQEKIPYKDTVHWIRGLEMTFQSAMPLCGPFPFLITEWITALFNNMRCQALSRGIFLLLISFHFFSCFCLSSTFTSLYKDSKMWQVCWWDCRILYRLTGKIFHCLASIFHSPSLSDDLESLWLKSQILIYSFTLLIFCRLLVKGEASKE